MSPRSSDRVAPLARWPGRLGAAELACCCWPTRGCRPAGTAHSGGVEALVDRGLLRTEADLARFLRGRLRTGAAVPAAAAAAACGWPATAATGPDWSALDAAVSARTAAAAHPGGLPGPGRRAAADRRAGLAVGRARRAAPRCRGPHHPLVLGAAAAAAGADPADARRAGRAPSRRRGLPPRCGCSGSTRCGSPRWPRPPAGRRSRWSTRPPATHWPPLAADDPDLLPADGSPLTDILAQLHHRSEATLFAS